MFWMTMRQIKRAYNTSSGESGSLAASAPARPNTSPIASKRRRWQEDAMDWDTEAPEGTEVKRSSRLAQKQSLRGAPSGESVADVNRTASVPMALSDVPVQLCHTFSCRTKFDSKACKPVHIAYTTNGHLVISDPENQKVKVFDTMGHLKVECCVPRSYACGLLEPQGVASLATGEIVTCDRKAGNLKVFTPEGKCLTTMGRQLMRPSALAVNSQSSIIICDEGRRDVFVFRSITDRKPLSVCKINGDRVAFHLPSQLCVTYTDHIVVYDSVDKKVWLFDKEGHLCSDNLFSADFFFQTPNAKKNKTETMKQLKYSGGLALCRSQGNCILLGHLITSRVVRFDIPQNQVIREVIEQNNNNITRPVAMAANMSGYLAVLEEGQETVKIFRYMT